MRKELGVNKRLMLIDGNSILNRAFYGLQTGSILQTSDGIYTNAVYGFINIMNKYFDEVKPEYVGVAFDLKKPTFRHEEYKEYKANRKGMPEELVGQVSLIKEVLKAMSITQIECEGFEADDIIGSLSMRAENEEYEVIILTGDRDAIQLVSDKTTVLIPSTRMGKTETTKYNVEAVQEKYGLKPEQLIEVKGLMGDPSDNIPGVPGVGEKTALKLIQEYGSIEKVYENINFITGKKLNENLKSNEEKALLSKRLGTIVRDMEQICGIEELRLGDIDRTKLYQLFKRLEFKKLIQKYDLSEDLTKGDEAISQVPEDKPVEISYELEYAESQAWERIINEIKLNQQMYIYHMIDKTSDFDMQLHSIAISADGLKVYYCELMMGQEHSFFQAFSEVLAEPEIKKYGHDMKGFITYLKKNGFSLEGLEFDTMIAAYILNPSETSYPITDICSNYLNTEAESIEQLQGKGKDFKKFCQIDKASLSQISAYYIGALVKVIPIMKGKIIINQQEELFYKIELPLILVLADMETLGFKVDLERLKSFSAELTLKISHVEKKIFELAGEEFNVNSPKQLGAILFDKLGLPTDKKTKTGYSTNVEVLEKLAENYEIADRVIEYRQLAKLNSTYAEGLQKAVNPNTGKIYSSFNQTVTTTGRISSTEPNLQNIPIRLEMGREIRKVFIPTDDEYLLMDADYSQIELRVLAHISGDSTMIEAFSNNEDIHTATAAQVFNVDKNEVTSQMRGAAKAVNFGIVYGIGDFSLGKDLGISKKKAREYIDGYLEKYPMVKKYMTDIVEQGKKLGYVTTLFNRRRYLPELQSKNFNIKEFGKRIAMNTPIQGSAADIIKVAMVKVYKALKAENLRSRLILQVHDELIIEVHKDETDKVQQILSESMEGAYALMVPLVADIKIGMSWYETK